MQSMAQNLPVRSANCFSVLWKHLLLPSAWAGTTLSPGRRTGPGLLQGQGKHCGVEGEGVILLWDLGSAGLPMQLPWNEWALYSEMYSHGLRLCLDCWSHSSDFSQGSLRWGWGGREPLEALALSL